MSYQGAEPSERLLFEALIVPHRSLTPNGLRFLMAAIAGLCALIALRFWLAGAWPVVAFSVVEVGLVIGLLRLNVRRARASELVLLGDRTVRIVRTDENGRREERSLSSAWMNVVLEESPGRIPRLLLATRGRGEEIGKVLGEAAKRELAEALRSALHDARHPQFDNAQLR